MAEQNLRLEWMDADALEDNPANWRLHPDYQENALRDLLSEVGWAGVLLYNERTQRLIDGHLRKKVAQGQQVPVVVGSWSEEDEAKILATLDPVAAMATTDLPLLEALIANVSTESEAIRELLISIVNEAQHITIKDGILWSPKEITSTERALDVVGYDLGSVWMRVGDAETSVFDMLLPLPKNPAKAKKGALTANYSRSPAREMQWIVTTYMRRGDYFLENCAGWWTFSTTAALNGYSGEGVDLWDVSMAFGRRQLSKLPSGAGTVKQIKGDARSLPHTEGHFTFAYCNPPFWQLERYSSDERDLAATSSIEEWLVESTKMLMEMKRVVKPGSLIVTVMADYRQGGTLVPLHSRWIDSGIEAGLELHDIVVQHLLSQQLSFWRHAWKTKRTAKAHEYIIVFKKP